VAVTPDELDDYEDEVDREEAVVAERDDERDLSDGEELADVVAERDSTPFDDTRFTYSGVVDGDEDVDVAGLRSAGALLDDPNVDVDPDDTATDDD